MNQTSCRRCLYSVIGVTALSLVAFLTIVSGSPVDARLAAAVVTARGGCA